MEKFFYATLIILFISTGCKQKPEPLTKFFIDNKYNLIYPVDDAPEPGAIYEETQDKGLGQPLAYKETCAKDLNPKPGKISFGIRSATSEIGLNFLLVLSQQLVKVKADLEGAFKKEVSYTVTSDIMDAPGFDWVTLSEYVREKVPPGVCQDALRKGNAVVLSRVAATKEFTFKFKGLKSGGIGTIRQSFINAGLNAEKKDEETIILEYNRPMKLCYQRWTPEELGVIAPEPAFTYAPGWGPISSPKEPLPEGKKELTLSSPKELPRQAMPSSKEPSTSSESPVKKETWQSSPRPAAPKWDAKSLKSEKQPSVPSEPADYYSFVMLTEPGPPKLNDFTKEFFGIKE